MPIHSIPSSAGSPGFDEGLPRWRQMLSGTAGERVRKIAPFNMLTGAWLHAAARAEQGLELTDWERDILNPLGEMLGASGVSEIGRVYREASEEGRQGVVPASVASRNLQEGFTREEFIAELTKLHQMMASQPNVEVVDPTLAGSQDRSSSPEFVAAAADYGFTVTVFNYKNSISSRSVSSLRPFHARLEWDRFYCQERTYDQGGGRDEIYWTSSVNAYDYGRTSRTVETGSVANYHWYSIGNNVGSNNKVMFDKQGFAGSGALSITCWEADQSSSEWYTQLGNALQRVVNSTKQGNVDFLDFTPTPFIFDLVWTGLGMITAFWESLRNKDDLVLSRGIAFGTETLAAVSSLPGQSMRIEFKTPPGKNGWFDLHLKYTGGPVPLGYRALTLDGPAGTAARGEAAQGWASQSFTLISANQGPDTYAIKNTYNGLFLNMSANGVVTAQPSNGTTDQVFKIVKQGDGSDGIRRLYSGDDRVLDVTDAGLVTGHKYSNNTFQSFNIIHNGGHTAILNRYHWAPIG
ncbi:RICIN domain-containing protein [Streptomyces arboris]|uniref:RICIN domain-containing protein n=1 Tax=Streptomyces arboris TaxID=2600619 RepID=UPI0036369435